MMVKKEVKPPRLIELITNGDHDFNFLCKVWAFGVSKTISLQFFTQTCLIGRLITALTTDVLAF